MTTTLKTVTSAEMAEKEREGKVCAKNLFSIKQMKFQELVKPINNVIFCQVDNSFPPVSKFCDVSDRAVWCLSSCKNHHGINELLNESLETYWQSDGPQPHTVTVQFPQKTVISEICLYNDYKVDESYTPSR